MDTLPLGRTLRTPDDTVIVDPLTPVGNYLASLTLLDAAGATLASAELDIVITDAVVGPRGVVPPVPPPVGPNRTPRNRNRPR